MIQVNNLSKCFKVHKKQPGFLGSVKSLIKRDYIQKHAIKDLNIDIQEGEIVGLIGSNGAGKTTLTKILSGIIHPSGGQVSVLGFNPWERNNQYRSQMAVIMGQKAQLWWDLPAMDGFLLLKEIYQIDEKEFHESIKELSSLLEIKDELNIQVRRLSLGERMKVELMAALLHKPKIIFLDEPTIGLDIRAQKTIRQFLKEYRKKYNPTMILTSHYMDDIEELCERIIILKKGQKIYDDTIVNLHQKFAKNKMIKATCSQESCTLLKDNFPIELGEFTQIDEQIKIISTKEKIMEAAQYILTHSTVQDMTIQNEELSDIIDKISGSNA